MSGEQDREDKEESGEDQDESGGEEEEGVEDAAAPQKLVQKTAARKPVQKMVGIKSAQKKGYTKASYFSCGW